MKKWILAMSVLSISVMLGNVSVFAQPQSIVLNTNGSEVKWNDEHNRLLIPAEAVTRYFGAEVKVNGNSNSIDVVKGTHTLHFETDNEFYTMDGIGGRKIDCKAQISGNKAYLPLRYICEAFGADVDYKLKEQTATIKTEAIVLDEELKPYFENVQVFDQSTIRITGDKTVYFDPRRVLGEPHDADIIFITHTHNDHYEIDSIRRVMKPSTVVYITNDGLEQAKADGLTNVIGVEPNKDYQGEGISFSTVSAYNTAAERQNHKAEYNWVGYIAEINGYTYYSAGDSDFTAEMKHISKPIDVAFFPIDGKYNMGAEEAAQAANEIKPKAAVPYHYNNFVPENKAQEFVNLLEDDIKGAIVTFKMQ